MGILAAIVCLFCAQPVSFNVRSGPAVDTIVEWGVQAHMQVLFDWSVVVPYQSQPVSGVLEPLEALRKMLERTDLQFEYVNDHTVAVYGSERYCHPERGPLAPLPPCEQPPLVINGEENL